MAVKDQMTLAQYRDHVKKPKRSKYGNKKVHVDGMTFDSMKEYRRWIELNALQVEKKIRNLKRQVEFVMDDRQGKKVVSYIADFTYDKRVADNSANLVARWVPIVEDVKGFKTAMYKLKKKLMLAVHNISILET